MADDKKTAAAGPRTQTYPLTSGNRVKLYVQGSDAADGASGAFADIATAIRNAKHFVFIADWSFQPLTRVAARRGSAALADTVGHMLIEAAKKPDMLVAIHAWDHTGIGAPDDQNDSADSVLKAIVKATSSDKKRPSNLLWRLSSRLGTGRSHHQKFVVLDADEGDGRRVIKAFFGGLDLTKGRFDFAHSPIMPPAAATTEPFAPELKAKSFSANDWYNAEFGDDLGLPRQAWQDYYGSIVGPSAWDVLREFVGRWNVISSSIVGPQGDLSDAQRGMVRSKFISLFDKGKLVQEFEPHNGPFRARVVRSIEKEDWGECLVKGGLFDKPKVEVTTTPTADGSKQHEFKWSLDPTFESSIQSNYLTAIANANRFIYIETQYLIGSGSKWDKPQSTVRNTVPEAIVDKIVDRIERGEDFHAYVVIPMFPEGNPISGAAQRQRFFEFATMRFMAQSVARKATSKGRDWREFLTFYFLANWSGVGPAAVAEAGKRKDRARINQRYQLYVHSKLLIADDQCLILGSANLNERSLAGDRDSEICVVLSPDDGKLADCEKQIGDLRRAAWARHLEGVTIPDIDSPEKRSCSGAIMSAGLDNWVQMAQGVRKNKSSLINIPFEATDKAFFVRTVSLTPQLQMQDPFIFDAPATAIPAGRGAPSGVSNGTRINNDWAWHAPNGGSFISDELAE